jgi:hypothetical protein
VTSFDVLRITRFLNVNPLLFTSHLRQSPDLSFPAFRVGDLASQLAFLSGSGGECPFLLALGSKVRCGIYVHRPLVCRLWPWRREGDGRGGDCTDCCFKDDGKIDKLRLEVLSEQSKEEREYFGRIVATWNGCRLPAYEFEHFVEYSLQETEQAYDYYSAWRDEVWC